ncbi:hypothetical protein ACHAXT_006558 [Thalassiosira profunda]
MAKSGTDRRFEAASLAVVDGIHLCLLPPDCGGVVGGGGDDSTIAVPAVPLARVREALGGEHAPFAQLGNGNADAPADDSRGDAEGAPDLMTSIEIITVRPSDLSRASYRFVHSTSLVEGASKRSLRVFGAHAMEEASVTLADDGHVEVCLPSFASDFAPESAGDDGDLIFGDDEGTNGPGQSDAFGDDAPVCAVEGAGCCIVVDLLGIAGYEQALVSPQVEANLLSAAWEGGADGGEAFQQRKQLLQTILRRLCVMDGAGLVRSKYLAETPSGERVGETLQFTMQPVEGQNVGDRYATTMSPETQPSSSGMLTQEEVEMQSSEQSDIPTKEGTDNEMIPQEDPAWLKAIAETVSGRLAKEAAKAEQQKKSSVAQAELVRRGRKALHEASRCNFNTTTKSSGSDGYFDPEVCRLRYGTRPRTSLETSGGISSVLDLEIDVYVPSDGKSRASSADTGVFHDFHLSCALANKHQSTGDQSSATRSKIRTVSGVVPTLKSGDCVTILASVLLSELWTSLRDGDDTSTLDISIQGLWADASSDAQRVASNPTQQKSRQGAVLCILRLPLDALLATPSITTPPRSGHWIQQEIDFASVGDASSPAPTALFEYRQPRTLVIDTSGDTQHDIAMWKELVTNLNSIVGWSSFIDLYCKKGDPWLKLVVFGSNPEERAATVKLVLKSLPQSAKLVLEEDPDERQRVKALLMSLKNEAEALKRHRALRTEIRPESLAEIGTLQMHTDGVASTIKRGWV